MPIKKDEMGRRWVEMELLVPGTPEQVWRAMATGAGVTAWFTRTEIDERVGGAIRFDMGKYGESVGEITAWEPPLHLAYVEREWSEGAPPCATEISIVARSGGRCLVRMVHSLFASTDDWDDQLEGFEGGWPAFFDVLRLYLAHFAGLGASIGFGMVATKGAQAQVWRQLMEALALADAHVGDRRASSGGPEPLSGEVERIDQNARQRYALLRLDAPAPGLALVGTYGGGDSTNVSASLYFYGEGSRERAARSEERWQAWLEKTFPPAG